MNRTFHLLFWFAILAPASSLQSQVTSNQVFKLYDLDLYTKDSTNAKASIRNSGISEINAQLLVQLDKKAIGAAIRDMAGTGDPALLAQIEQLKMLLRNQVEIMERFNSNPSDPDFEGLAQLAELVVPFLEEVEANTEWRTMYNEFSAKYDQTYTRAQRRTAGTGDIPFREEFIINEFSLKIADLSSQIAEGIPTDKIKFLLSGSLRPRKGGSTRSIKLSDDFDELEPDVYFVPRWQTSLSEQDLQSLNEIGALSQEMNQLMLAKGKDIKNWLKSQLQAPACIQEIETLLTRLPSDAKNLTEVSIQKITEIVEAPIAKARQLANGYSENERAASALSNVSLLTSLNTNLSGTISEIDGLIRSLDEDIIAVFEGMKDSPEVQAFITTYGGCKEKLLADKNKLLEIGKRFSGLLINGKKASDSAAAIDDKVRRLGFDEIPSQSKIDLTFSGARQNGDEISIQATLEREVDGNVQRKNLGGIDFTVQQIGLYSVVKPMLLLADPLGSGEHIQLERRFQFAPSYSMLFKWGSRKSKFFNDVLSPAIGINFAAPDFDTDGVPEFAAAAEFSILRDYLGVGLGYNFLADSDYYFVGFRLPIGAVALPIFNDINTR